jgi:hypothetical protein
MLLPIDFDGNNGLVRGHGSKAPRHSLTCMLPSQFGALDIVQARAKWPKWQHFLHWFGRLEYRIFCRIVSFGVVHSAIEGI